MSVVLQINHKQTPRWPTLIRQYRRKLGLNKTEFGRLFGVSRQSVLYWETGKNEAPYRLTWHLYRLLEKKLHE